MHVADCCLFFIHHSFFFLETVEVSQKPVITSSVLTVYKQGLVSFTPNIFFFHSSESVSASCLLRCIFSIDLVWDVLGPVFHMPERKQGRSHTHSLVVFSLWPDVTFDLKPPQQNKQG